VIARGVLIRERMVVQPKALASRTEDRMHTVSIREAAWHAIPDAYRKASANNTLPGASDEPA
jgi:hypothetical protein